MGSIFEPIRDQLPVKCQLCLFGIFTSERGYYQHWLTGILSILFVEQTTNTFKIETFKVDHKT